MKSISVFLTAAIISVSAQISSAADLSIDQEIKGQVYRTAIAEPVNNFDPIHSSLLNENIIRNLYSTLVEYRSKKVKPGEKHSDIVPYLAHDWNISSDRRIYNFKIKENAYFHNGRRMTAYDVKHTIERLANPKILPSSLSWLFNDIQIRGMKKYQQDCRNNKAEVDLEGVKVLDNFLVQIILDKPTPLFLKALAMPVFSIIPKEEVDKWGKEFAQHPVGTGPYALESSTNEKIVLKKNNRYFEKGLPNIPSVVYKVVEKLADEYKLFQQGELEQTDIPDSEIDKIMQQEQWSKFSLSIFDKTNFNDRSVSEIIKEPKLVSTFLGVSTKRPELNSVKVRQALNHSVNKSKLISNVLKYKAIPLLGALPEHFPNAPENRTIPYPYDVIKAKKLLYETGLVDYNGDGILEYKSKPVSINLWYYHDAETEKVCNALAEDLQAVGFKVNLNKNTDWKQFLQGVISGQADIYHFSWRAKYPDPDKFLSPLFSSENIGKTNFTNFSNAKVDNLLKKARNIPGDEFRNELYRDIDKTIVEQATWVFLYQPVKYVIVKPYVYGMEIHPVLHDMVKFTYFNNQEVNVSLSKKSED